MAPTCRILLLAAAVLPAMPAAAELPEPIIRMLVEAHRGGDDAQIAAVVKIAKRTYPDDAVEIDRLVAGDAAVLAQRRRAERRAEEARIRAAGFLDIWKGEVEVGGSRATGNSNVISLYASAKLVRDALEWRQRLQGRFDFQRTDGVQTVDRTLLAYQANYKFTPRFYTLGLAQYERDSFLGYSDRYTAGAGLGYDIADRAELKLSVEGGPAVRRTHYVDEGDRTTIAARASVSARWSLSPNLVFTQDAAGFIEQGNRNAVITSALDTKLIGALKARFSYNILYEHDAPEQRRALDTLSRATLVYSF